MTTITINGNTRMIGTHTMIFFQAIVAASALLLSQTIPSQTEWMAVVERLGLAIALVAFFVWTGWEREKRMGKRIDYLEKQLTALSGKLVSLGDRVVEITQRDLGIVEKVVQSIESRPCMAFETIEEYYRWRDETRKDR